MSEKHPIFQSILDEAEKESKRYSPHPSRQEFLEKVSGLGVIALPLAGLIYQVQNGGFYQWWSNNYGKNPIELGFLRTALHMVGSRTAREALVLVNQFVYLCEDDPDRLDDEEFDMFRFSENRLNDRFYEIDNQLLDDIEKMFVNIGVREPA
jgi:hypothetical protein